MIQTGGNYNSILQGRFSVEYKFNVNNVDYFERDIVDGTIDEQLFEKFGVGNLMTKMLDIVFLPETNVPRKSVIKVYFRIKNELQTSEWYPKGTYYVSTRALLSDGSLRVRAYDGSLKAKVVFAPEGSTWEETTAFALYEEVCDKLGINENAETAQYIEDNDLPITVAPDMGQSGTTMKEIISYIGVLYGKNWIVNEYNELAMIFPYQTAPDYDVADVFISPTVTVDRIRIWQNESAYIEYPDVEKEVWDAMNGYVVEATCPYVNADNIADVADNIIGLEYTGFDAADVVEDPALQLGDGLTLDENEVMLARRIIVIGDEVTQCYAPYEEETESEYPETSPVARIVNKAELRTYAAIETSAAGINSTVQSVRDDLDKETEARIAEDLANNTTLAGINNRLDSIDGENGSIAALRTRVVETESGVTTLTETVREIDGYIQTQQSYMNWDGVSAVLSVGKTGEPIHTEMRSDAFAVTTGDTDLFWADEAGGHARSFTATEYVKVGDYRWVDEGSLGYSLI